MMHIRPSNIAPYVPSVAFNMGGEAGLCQSAEPARLPCYLSDGPRRRHPDVASRHVRACAKKVSLIGELQYTLSKNAVLKLNMGVGVAKKAPTYAPEIGVVFKF